MGLTKYKVGLNFGFLTIHGEWEPSENEKKAAWEMYVELVTRITVAELGKDDGTIREAFNSLHSLFETTREILRKYGPDVAKSGAISFGYVAVTALNGSIRPFLAKWHPTLRDFEELKPKDKTTIAHEREWPHNQEVRNDLKTLRQEMLIYANQLAEICQVDALHTTNDKDKE